MKYLQEALEYVQNTDNKLLHGKILYNMGQLNHASLWYTDAITLYRQALKMFQRVEGEYQRESLTMNAIANSFLVNNQTDSAQYYYKQALSLANRYEDTALQAMVFTNMGFVYGERGSLDTAKYYAGEALRMASTDGEKVYIYKNLAQILSGQEFSDSARYYLAKAEALVENIDNVFESASLAYLNYLVEKSDGNCTKAMEYFEMYAQNQMAITESNDRQMLLEMQKKYDIAIVESEYNKAMSGWWKIVGLLCVVSLALALAVAVTQKKNMRQRDALAKSEKEKMAKELELANANKERTVMFLDKLGIMKSIVLLKISTPETLQYDVNKLISNFTTQKFIDATNDFYPGFSEKLKANFPNVKLSEEDIRVCCLIVCGFSNKELVILMDGKKDKDAIEKLKSRIRKKMGIPSRGDIQLFLLEKVVA